MATRQFDKKMYHYHSAYGSKRDADAVATGLRTGTRKYSVRVVRKPTPKDGRTWHALYIRRKR